MKCWVATISEPCSMTALHMAHSVRPTITIAILSLAQPNDANEPRTKCIAVCESSKQCLRTRFAC